MTWNIYYYRWPYFSNYNTELLFMFVWSIYKNCQIVCEESIIAISSLSLSIAILLLSLYNWIFGGRSKFGSLADIDMHLLYRIIKLCKVQQETIISSCCSCLIFGILSTNIFHLPFKTPKVLFTVIRKDECRWLNRSFTPLDGPYLLNCGVTSWESEK